MSNQLPYIAPLKVLQIWPQELPILYLGGNDRLQYIASSFEEIDWQTVRHLPLPHQHKKAKAQVFEKGFMGVAAYNNEAPNRVFKVDSVLAFDKQSKLLWLTNPLNLKMKYSLSEEFLEILKTCSTECEVPDDIDDKAPGGWKLEPTISDAQYLSIVNKCLADIRKGRFYQINFLRYFQVQGDTSRSHTLKRLEQFSEPFAAYFDLPDLTIASFSPERFVKIQPDQQHLGDYRISTFPIKGTVPRGQNSEEDEVQAASLLASKKDHAELHMIVDLMRNDLSKVSISGTTEVVDPGSIKTFTKVHHLVAHITSKLRTDITFGDILDNLTPAGSITGAPKIEVMSAIQSYESRARRYFMGNIFYWDYCGYFDSSILIRTLIKESSKNFDFAAGSGIVINSNAINEMHEVEAKCRVITESK